MPVPSFQRAVPALCLLLLLSAPLLRWSYHFARRYCTDCFISATHWLLNASFWLVPRLLFLFAYIMVLSWITLLCIFLALRCIGVFRGAEIFDEPTGREAQ
ncbi:membrane protein O1 [macacine betaherpesvirus 3]|nr:Rh03.1 [macacine betaherpesvirus 3]QQL10507.1 Rh03.1 [Rhesus cytomegalovirus strain 68-1.2]QQL10689.1 Rh03.1 [Rhesus cytomegalovirus strain 68-1_FL]QXV50006.1 membrane protein O1 [macacine betaherpesvirus 3]QXV50184.1 membrane protein O1 [macacine betaherpesvirus 3]